VQRIAKGLQTISHSMDDEHILAFYGVISELYGVTRTPMASWPSPRRQTEEISWRLAKLFSSHPP